MNAPIQEIMATLNANEKDFTLSCSLAVCDSIFYGNHQTIMFNNKPV